MSRAVVARIALVVLVAGGAAGVARLRAGPAAEVADVEGDPLSRAGRHFRAALAAGGTEVGGLVVTPEPEGGPGVQVWYDAPPAHGVPRDLYVFSARLTANGVPLERSTAVPVVATPAADEALLAAGPGQGLVAVGSPPTVLSLRRLDGARLELQLEAPAEVTGAALTAAGFRAQVGGQVVEVAPGRAPDGGVLVVVPPSLQTALPNEAVVEAPLAPPAPAEPVSVPPQPMPGLAPWVAVTDGIWRSEVEGVHLFVIDTRGVELVVSAGLHAPPEAGRSGRGTSPADATARVWLDAPPRVVAEGRQRLAEPVRLAPSILVQGGLARLGAWDREDPEINGDLAQAEHPLVLDGAVVARRVHHPGDATPQPRSALGATAAGVLVFAWSSATTTVGLGDALRRVGVDWALPAGTGPAARGLGVAGSPPPVAGMSAAEPGPRAHNVVLLVPRAGFRPPAPWQPVAGIPVRLATRSGPGRLRWALLDATATRLEVVPGPAEPGGDAHPAVDPPAASLAALTFGVRSQRAPFGLAVGEQRWRAPRPQAFTLALDEEGHPHFGRLGQRIDPQRAWSALIQGPALLEGGRRSVEPVIRDGLPVAAFGRRADGHLVFVASPEGDVEGLVAALEAERVTDALRLADRGTLDGGQVVVGGRDALSGLPRAAAVATALHVLPADPPPSVEVVPAIR